MTIMQKPSLDQALNDKHLVVLRAACEHRRRLCGSSRIEELSSITDLPNETIIEIAETVRNSYYDQGVELFMLPKEAYLVIGWRQGQAFAVTPAIGTVGEKQLFQLAPVIIETAKAKIDPQGQRKADQGTRKGSLIASVLFAVFAALAHAFGVESRGEAAAAFLMIMALFLAGFPLVLMPWSNRRIRINTNRALHEMCAA